MKVPLTVADYLRRAELVYPDRIGVVDEPDQPAASWGALTYREVAERARAQAAALDELGIAQGERVAIVSQNSARLLTSFFGVSGSGRILVPVNFRLNADEVAYILDNADAEVLVFHGSLDDRVDGARARLPQLRVLLQVDDGAPLLDGARWYHEALAAASPAPRHGCARAPGRPRRP